MYVDRIHDAIYRIRTPYEGGGTVFLYLLKGDRVALIDTGTTSSPEQVLVPALAEIGMGLADVEMILNSHGHHDHAGGNLAAKVASGATLHIHPADLPMARSVDAELEYHVSPMRELGFPDELIQRRTRAVVETAGTEKAAVDGLLSHGEAIDLGHQMLLRVIHTPGHTPGSVCFYWEREGVLFTADAVQGMGPRAGSFPYYADAVAYRRSLELLATLDVRMLCMGHAAAGGGVINDPTRRGEDCRRFVEDSLRISDTIHGAVAAAVRERAGASKREIALAALADLLHEIPQLHVRGAGMPMLAGRTLLAHMEVVGMGG